MCVAGAEEISATVLDKRLRRQKDNRKTNRNTFSTGYTQGRAAWTRIITKQDTFQNKSPES